MRVNNISFLKTYKAAGTSDAARKVCDIANSSYSTGKLEADKTIRRAFDDLGRGKARVYSPCSQLYSQEGDIYILSGLESKIFIKKISVLLKNLSTSAHRHRNNSKNAAAAAEKLRQQFDKDMLDNVINKNAKTMKIEYNYETRSINSVEVIE
ncbi:hypothetical protein IJ531_01640 [bacterium]|nr:hypothetical protein [bacterium]